MSRHTYRIANALGIALIVAVLLESIIYLQIGTETYWLESYPRWFIFFSFASFTWAFMVLKYYHHKNYQFAFWAGVFTIAASVFNLIVSYRLISGDRSMAMFFTAVIVLFSVTNVVRGVSLVGSEARKMMWLRIAGVVSLILGLAGIVGIAGSLAPEIQQAIFFLARLTPIFFIMNFVEELKVISTESESQPSSLETGLLAAGVISIFAMMGFGSGIAGETFSKVTWNKQLTVRAEQWNKLFETRTYVNDSDTLSYKLLLPLEYDSANRYPLVVALPYGGSVEGCPPAQMLISDDNRKKYPSFLLVPFSPEGTGWGGIPDSPAIDAIVFETIDTLKKEFHAIDARKVYVTGVSKGAYGSWHFIITRPDMFAAAIPVCGAGNPDLASKVINTGVWAFHGEDDRNVPVKGSRDMITAIKNAGGNPKYTEFPDLGHNIWHQVSLTPGLLDWLFQQKQSRP